MLTYLRDTWWNGDNGVKSILEEYLELVD